ncbi:MAG: hypothetical protein K6A28_06020 [Bacteroidales bacterium]|nr:hypothetical protein [Bacteroidales bacterium]
MVASLSAQIPIELDPGWNWISYPYSEVMYIDDALEGRSVRLVTDVME